MTRTRSSGGSRTLPPRSLLLDDLPVLRFLGDARGVPRPPALRLSAGGGGFTHSTRVARPAAFRHRVLRRRNSLSAAAGSPRARARRVPHAPRVRDPRALG